MGCLSDTPRGAFPRPRGLGPIEAGRYTRPPILHAEISETARSRKSQHGGLEVACTDLLQWGRDRAVSEMPRVACPTDIPCKASMGPRPRGLGNSPPTILFCFQ